MPVLGSADGSAPRESGLPRAADQAVESALRVAGVLRPSSGQKRVAAVVLALACALLALTVMNALVHDYEADAQEYLSGGNLGGNAASPAFAAAEAPRLRQANLDAQVLADVVAQHELRIKLLEDKIAALGSAQPPPSSPP